MGYCMGQVAFAKSRTRLDEYVAALEIASSYRRSGDELTISYNGGTMRFEVLP